MATYRPKSLEELNEFYDKAKSAEQAFQKGKSLLKEENIYIETEFPIIDTTLSDFQMYEKPNQDADQGLNNEFSTGIDNMLNSLLSDVKGEAAGHEQSITYKSEDAPIKGKELSGLMDDYVKVMTDGDYYDEDEDFEVLKKDSSKKRRKAKKKTKYFEEAAEDIAVEVENSEVNNGEPENEEYGERQSVDDYQAADEKNSDFKISLPEDELGYPEFERPEELARESEEFSLNTAKKSKIKSVGGVITSILLVLVLIATIVVGTINMTLKVNTGLPAFKSFYFFTTSQSHPAIGIKNGDFVVCKRQTEFDDGTSVAYIDRTNGTFSFGIKTETSKSKDDYGNQLYVVSGTSVKQSDVIGLIKSNIPFLGKIVRAVLDNYLTVLGGLVLLAVILTLIRCFAFNDKNEKSDKRKKKANDSSSDEQLNEYSENEFVLNDEYESDKLTE